MRFLCQELASFGQIKSSGVLQIPDVFVGQFTCTGGKVFEDRCATTSTYAIVAKGSSKLWVHAHLCSILCPPHPILCPNPR